MKAWWSPPALLVLLVVHWNAVLVQAGSIFCDDSDLCLSKRFLRFGRALSQDPYYRIGRQFYRLSRGGYQPYQDKRFLRFGRSQLLGLDDAYGDNSMEQSLGRKRRSTSPDSQLDFTHDHVRRSADQSQLAQPGADETPKTIKKRSIDDEDGDVGLGPLGVVATKRFMRFGRGFQGNDDADDTDSDEIINKRFMRFGKRLIPVKRFMRFGRNQSPLVGNFLPALPGQASKRFMRFGKRKQEDAEEEDDEISDLSEKLANAEMNSKMNDVIALANQISRGSELKDQDLYGMDKRFMRFGKRDSKTVGLQSLS